MVVVPRERHRRGGICAFPHAPIVDALRSEAGVERRGAVAPGVHGEDRVAEIRELGLPHAGERVVGRREHADRIGSDRDPAQSPPRRCRDGEAHVGDAVDDERLDLVRVRVAHCDAARQ